jgi:eukaryotic-like serine/threonine-protein kinase
MNASESAAEGLIGLELEDGWRALSRVELPDDHSGSAFSVGYLADHQSSGRMGYLKAFDYSDAMAAADPARALMELTASYNAERDLLDVCGRRSLDRVVRALAGGTVRVPGFSPDAVSYLIFELADGDARDMRSVIDPADHVPMMKIAHDAAVALSQLHGIGVSHQDVKPSNVLVWDPDRRPSGKLGDLGCAHSAERPAPHDDKMVPGDCSYAAPEQLYHASEALPASDRRYAADVYMLGNLLTFLLSGISHSGLMYVYLDRSLHWRDWGGSFSDVLPALVDAHGLVLGRIREVLYRDVQADVTRLLGDLCHPDPAQRGDSVARRRGQNPFALQRFVTRLDLLYRRSIIGAST